MRKIFLTLFALFALAIPAAAQQEPSRLDTFLEDFDNAVQKGNEAVGNAAPVITSCGYGNTMSPVEQYCALLDGGGWVPIVGKPATRVALLVHHLSTTIDDTDNNRFPGLRDEAKALITQWYNLYGITSKRCSVTPGALFKIGQEAEARFGLCSGDAVADALRQELIACNNNAEACTVSQDVWTLVQSSLLVVEKSVPSERAEWTNLQQAVDSYKNTTE